VKEPTRDPKLDHLDALVGEWDTEMTHPLFATAVRGRTVFEWLTGRAFLIWRVDAPPNTVPTSISIIGGGDTPGVWPMHYFDSRGVERVYQMSFDDGAWKMWRDQPGFSQRATGTFEDDGRTINWRSELQREGPWKRDLEVIYRRRGR
jgi:hypothetical protein